MSTPRDGGPAFPAPSVYGDENKGHQLLEPGELGMTLRDYFAGQALAGLLTAWLPSRITAGVEESVERIADTAYRLADAMIAKGGVS